jgi:DNA-binding MarR family transcriptional regulator
LAADILTVIPGVMRILDHEIRQSHEGLAPAQFRLMFMLARRPRSLTELAESQSVSLATMSNSVAVLVQRGWMKRKKDPDDRRRLFLELTARGSQVFDEVYERAARRLNDMLAATDEVQCQDLRRGLELLNGIFSQEADVEINMRREGL